MIAPSAHRMLDFATVIGFCFAPLVFGLEGAAAALAYGLAVVHFGLTLLTRFPGGAARPVPLVLHGAIEAVVGILLIALPRSLGWSGMPRLFFMTAGVVILGVWAISCYRAAAPSAAA